MDFFWLFWAIVHSSAHPDTSFITVSKAGFDGLALYGMIVIISSLATLILFYGNDFFLSRVGARLTFFVKIKDFSNSELRKTGYLAFVYSFVKKLKYIGLAILSFIPIVIGIREVSLFIAQALGMKYALHAVLLVNGLRLYLLFLFGGTILEIMRQAFIRILSTAWNIIF